MAALTSDEINFLIYRYLRESGFEHSAFAFGHESFIYKSSLESSSIAPGALISFVQKGLQYSEIEAHIHEDGTESICDEPFSLLKKHQCRSKHAKRKIFSAFDSLDADYGSLEIDGALLLRVPIDPRDVQAQGGVGTSGQRSMSVCIRWHPHVLIDRNNKRGAAANAAADAQAQHTLLTANADGSVRIWRYRDEEDEQDEDEGERKDGETHGEAGAATPKQPFQKGYVCIRTLEQPAEATGASAAAASSADAAVPPISTAPVSNLVAAADAAAPMEDTAAAAAADSSAAAAASSSSAASSTPAAAAASPSDSSSATAAAAGDATDERSAKRQKLNDSTANGSSAAAAAASPAAAASCGHDHGAAGADGCHLEQNKTIVAVDWHPKGHTIACGSYTGAVYLWSLKGVLLHTLRAHTAPVTCVQFNKSGTLLLTGGVDHLLVLWDAVSGAEVQRWHLHTGPVLDVQWCPVFVSSSQSKNKDSVALQSTHPDNAFIFASCSTDGNIFVVDVRHDAKQQQPQGDSAAAASAAPTAASLAAGSGSAPRLLSGHEGEVNCISWDPTGTLLLSGSDDGTAKIWSAFSGDIVHDLVDHARGVLLAQWSGTGACTEHYKYPLFVATGSLDTTVRLWDPATGACLHTLAQHTHPVSQLAFAPRQQLLATASHERVFLWSLTSGALLRTFKNLGDPLQALPNHVPLGQVGGLLDLKFDSKGEQLAVSYADGMTYVIDLTNKQQWEEQARAGQ